MGASRLAFTTLHLITETVEVVLSCKVIMGWSPKNSGPLAGGATMNALWQSPISRAAGLILGALVAVPAVAAAPAPATIFNDVAPILPKNCQGCHRPGSTAPKYLLPDQATRPSRN